MIDQNSNLLTSYYNEILCLSVNPSQNKLSKGIITFLKMLVSNLISLEKSTKNTTMHIIIFLLFFFQFRARYLQLML